MSGYIKLYRSLLRWEWYDDANTMRLFLHCLLRANHEAQKWHGQEINAGQFITSLSHLSKELNLTISQIRTSLDKLENTQEIARKSQGSNTLIIIKNWNRFQENRKVIANQSQSDSKPIATNKNVKNEKNDKNIEEEEEEARPDLKNWYGEYMNVHLTDEQLRKLKSFILDDDFLFFLVDELSSNIAVGRAPRFDETQPWGHFAMVKKYWDFRRKNPQKFKPQSKDIDTEKRNKERENRIRELEEEWKNEQGFRS